MSALHIATVAATTGALGLIVHHHALYPLLLRLVGRRRAAPAPLAGEDVPGIAIVMPAHNEARHIASKLRNLAALDYPSARLRVIVLCDGCTDGTASLARAVLAEPDCAHLDAEIVEHAENAGKVARLNEGVARADRDIVVLTDVSALLPVDALRRAAAHFADPALGAVGGTYRIAHYGSDGEAAYWRMQLRVKRGEAALGAPLGLHGAFYAFRRAAFQPLATDTINDDFVLPMRIHAAGFRIAYDEAIEAVELERARPQTDRRRRRRIAAGNAQQAARLFGLLHPRHGGTAFCFASGKALRVAMPLLLVAAFAGTAMLAGASRVFAALLAAEVTAMLLALTGLLLADRAPRLCRVLAYLVAGHAMSLAGLFDYVTGRTRRAWRRATGSGTPHVPALVAAAKRGFDIAVASVGLVVSAPLWPLIALGVRLSGPGPIIFRQLRIGAARADRVELFRMMKFRSMYQDAEARSGAVWASKNDPRITPFGRFLRKTRLDEIPQLLNVLRGDMSIVGPRPERPGFYRRLEHAIPYFATRTEGLRPGITGLAQVRQGYDETLDDVRRKVAFDHAYAMRLSSLPSWAMLEASILFRTVAVMATGRGQ